MTKAHNANSYPIIFSDFDGTITQTDVTDEILTELAHPSWREVEQEWVRGAIGSRECLRRQMALVDASSEELETLIDSILLDPHFSAFLCFAHQAGAPFYVVSDGFDYVIRRVLKRAGLSGELRNGSHLFSSVLHVEGRRTVATFPHPACEHGCATCKPEVIRHVARELRGGANGERRPVVFIGDGFSDRFAVEEADIVFAKGQLLEYCGERGVASHAFETFADVERELRRLIGAPAPHASESSEPRANGRKRAPASSPSPRDTSEKGATP